MIDGTLQTIDGRPALRFERHLAHSVQRVWRAVTEPSEVAQWFVAPVPWTPMLGETSRATGACSPSEIGRRAYAAHPQT